MISHANRGRSWERHLEFIHRRYEAQDRAVVIRTPPTMRIIGSMGDGTFKACFEKVGPPDYILLADGKAIMAEAKECSGPRWALSNLHAHQAARLQKWREQGGVSIVLLHHKPSLSHWVIRWEKLMPSWQGWYERYSRKERSPPGSASMRLADIRQMGLFFESDYLDVLK